MPTPLPTLQKQAFIDIVSPINAYEADRLVDVLNNYEDIPIAINRQINAYAANNSYLVSCMSVWSSTADLNAIGIYFQETATAALTDPILIINCTYTAPGIDVQILDTITNLIILGRTDINNLILTANRTIQTVYIGPDSIVSELNSSPQNACVFNLTIAQFDGIPGALYRIFTSSCIGRFTVMPGAIYGGTGNANPSNACANPVTGIDQTLQTHDSVKIFWVLPGSAFSLIDIFYREQGSNTWLSVVPEDGDWANDKTFYTFYRLKRDTFYEIKVSITCLNGGIAETVLSNVQTNAS